MISFYRIGAVVFRHLMTMKRISWLVEIGYWTILDVIIFGSLGKATAVMAPGDASGALIQVLITNAVFWYLVLRGGIAIGFTLLTELFDANLIALFATPLRLLEWVISCIIIGSIAALINIFLGLIMAFLIFDCYIFAFGMATIAIIVSLLVSGWVLGLILMSILLFIGKRGTGLAFAICWSLVPFSCVYYPMEVMPPFLQKIISYIPMTQIFTAMRSFITNGANVWPAIITSFWLNGIYFVLVSLIFTAMFKRSKKRGLARLELAW